MHEDQRFIVGLMQQDDLIIQEIYQKFSQKIKRFVLANNGNESQAKDLFQESLVAIYEKAAGGNFELTCPFEAYFFIICKRKWFNTIRQNRRVTNIHESVFEGEDANQLSDSTLLHEERLKFLYLHLNKLGASCQNILKLSWKKMSMQEVADQLNISYAYARKKKSECLGKLSQNIQSDPRFKQLKSI